jgi:PAS domain-containing protein
MADGNTRAARAGLRVIDGGAGAPHRTGTSALFCGHCGRPPGRTPHTELDQVCEVCSLGVILEADAAAAPAGEPFILVDPALKILAVSDRAEHLLGVYEQDARGRSVTRYLIACEEPPGPGLNYAVAISDAFSDNLVLPAHARLRPRPAVSVSLRIARCAPPRAAVVVFTRTDEPKLQPAQPSGARGG